MRVETLTYQPQIEQANIANVTFEPTVYGSCRAQETASETPTAEELSANLPSLEVSAGAGFLAVGMASLPEQFSDQQLHRFDFSLAQYTQHRMQQQQEMLMQQFRAELDGDPEEDDKGWDGDNGAEAKRTVPTKKKSFWDQFLG